MSRQWVCQSYAENVDDATYVGSADYPKLANKIARLALDQMLGKVSSLRPSEDSVIHIILGGSPEGYGTRLTPLATLSALNDGRAGEIMLSKIKGTWLPCRNCRGASISFDEELAYYMTGPTYSTCCNDPMRMGICIWPSGGTTWTDGFGAMALPAVE